jgi:hypothetical protein
MLETMMSDLLRSAGKLIYSPRSHLASSERWLVLMCDDAISEYYRSMFYRQFPYLGKLTRPVWGAHISIIRGERVPNSNLWRLDENKIVEFEYEPGVVDNGEYYWLKVHCSRLEEIRMLYGLNSQPNFGFHLTIGRTSG